MDALVNAVASLAAARTLDDVMAIVSTSARALTQADGITFVLRQGDECFYADEEAIAPLWKGRRFPLETCISGWSMLNKQAALVPDIFADRRIPVDAYRPTFVKSLFMMPVGDEDPVAAIGAYWAEPHVATGAEQAVLEALAKAAALALRNIHLDGQLQEALKREQEARRSAEDAGRVKDEFLATLSHELRTPLHVIQNWIWQLKRSMPADPRLQKALEVIERNSELQSRLIEDLLDVSRATSGKLKVQTQLVDLAAMCTAVIEIVQLSARAKSIELECERERAPYVWGDPDRIQQILWNVLTNAIKFTPEHGRVRLQVTRGARHACVYVEDTGIGVAPQFLPHVFDRFRQADASSTRRFGGLGLGLTIVKELMSLHGGSVRAESDGLGKGLKVSLEFPVPAVLDQPGSWLMRRAGVELPGTRLDGISVL
ncbi:MAG: HAMP domain-containing sensor histidine kinase, partial [Steroidobacteraceae bacterium]